MAAHQGRTSVYRFFDADDVFIYVGIATDPHDRWKTHARVQPWWPEVDTREIEWFDTRAEAERTETREIADRRPKYNTHPGMPDRTTPAFAATRKRAGWMPTQELLDLFARHDAELRAAGRTRDAIEAELIEALLAGVTASRIAKFVPWRAPTVLAVAKKAGIPSHPLPGSEAWAVRGHTHFGDPAAG